MRISIQDRLGLEENFRLVVRERGKVVPHLERTGHNIFTDVGRGWLTRLIAWNTVGSPDAPFTDRRVRWVGVGTGTQEEVASVNKLVSASRYNQTDYLSPIDSVEFPTATSARIIKSFGVNDLTPDGGSVSITEAGLFADVKPANSLYPDDSPFEVGGTILDPASALNPPIAYKSFEPVVKTQDFTIEIHWELRF